MSRFHAAVRRTVVARLGGAALGATVYSSPPTNFAPPIVLVGQITADQDESISEPGGWHSVAVECWVRSHSPAELDTISDNVARQLDKSQLYGTGAQFSTIELVNEADTFNPDSPGGPTLGRVQTYRVFAQ